MLSTDIGWIASTIAALACIYAAYRCYYCEKIARQCLSWMDGNNKSAVTLRKLAELETEMTEVRDALEAYSISLKKLRSRIGMRKVREERTAEDEMPDPVKDPDGWKRAMRAKLQLSNIGGK